MRYEMKPVVRICELEAEVNERGVEVSELRPVLFFDGYINDCYKHYYFDYEGEGEEGKIIDVVNQILRETFPDRDSVLIDVSW